METLNKYPWINFEINLTKLSFKTWVKLGECFSKIEHISRIPLKPNIAAEMHTVYLTKGVLATTAIEGNTLSEKEVRLRIEKQLQLPPSKEYLGKEIDNIVQLCNEIKIKIQQEPERKITCEDICRYNEIILKEVPVADYVIPGKFRTYTVGAGTYKAPDSEHVTELMNKYCEWLNSSYFTIFEDIPVLNSIIKSIIAHLYFAWIHPFGDGNGRTARIIEFYILLSSGIPTPAAHLLSNHYNATRNEYYLKLDDASKKNDIIGFLSYAIQGLLDGLKEQLTYIFNLVIDISWESYVYEMFRESKHHELTTKRRRNLLLELSKKIDPVPMNGLMTISQSTIDTYRNKTEKTLTRDLKELEKMDLIEKIDKGYKAKKEKIFAFIPLKI
jgi:Fic family protein